MKDKTPPNIDTKEIIKKVIKLAVEVAFLMAKEKNKNKQ